MNYHDSERIAGLLERDGYEPAANETAADVVVLNTCSVRERAEEKLYSRLGEIRLATAGREEPVAVAVTGCVAQQEGDRLLRRAPFIDVIAGTQSLKQLPGLLEDARATRRAAIDIDPHEDVAFPLGVAKPSDPTRAWVTIIEGCNEFCAFCVVPYTRGNERMRPVADILADVNEAARSGRVEVQLLGQIVNHYQAPDDAQCDFAELLARVNDVPGIRRIRFASPHPRHVTPGLVNAIRDLPKVCKHLHLPVQSGSSRVLHSMRRRYTRETYLEGVARLRDAVPGIEISTDIIVGYPGETESEFDETMDLVRTVQFQSIYSFKYSVRPNTLASKRMKDDVTEGEKTRRIVALQSLQRDIQTRNHTRMVGSVQEVLVDSTSRRRSWEVSGRTFGNTIVNFPGPPEWLGQVVPVRITGAAPNTARGEAIIASGAEVNHAR
jgi:tRNA-2-methylthio-N6-dimethylallyladenosine synthase